MKPIVKNGTAIIWGKVTRDAKIYYNRQGKPLASFAMMYDRHPNEDGDKVNEYIEVTTYGDQSTLVGDDHIGVAKGDYVIVFGNLVDDNYRRPGEDPNIKKVKILADMVLDATSIFQVASLVVSGEAEADVPAEPKSTSVFDDDEEKTPFEDEINDADGELPY